MQDYKKDTTSNIASYGNNNDSNKISEHTPKLNSNNRNSDFSSFLIKRTEKIVAALYMVSDCFQSNEPLRLAVRQQGLSILKRTHNFPSRQSDVALVVSELKNELNHLSSLLNVAQLIGILSEMNADVLQTELLNLRDISEQAVNSPDADTTDTEAGINNRATRAASSFLLSPDFFGTPFNASINSDNSGNSASSDNSDRLNNSKRQPARQPARGSQTAENSSKGQSHPELSKTLSLSMKMERRSIILRLAKDKKEITVKDIATVFTNTSDKTLQRELASMVSDGVLKKEGEKRWSRYRLPI